MTQTFDDNSEKKKLMVLREIEIIQETQEINKKRKESLLTARDEIQKIIDDINSHYIEMTKKHIELLKGINK